MIKVKNVNSNGGCYKQVVSIWSWSIVSSGLTIITKALAQFLNILNSH